MRAPPDQDQVILRLRERDVISRLRDESAHGLAVHCAESVEVQEGDPLKIRTVAGWFEATVIRISPGSAGVTVGLARGPELLTERDFPVTSPGVSRWTLVAALGVGLLGVPLVSLSWPKSEAKRPTSATVPPANTAPPAKTTEGALPATSIRTSIPVLPTNRRIN